MAPAEPLRRIAGWNLDERVLLVAEIGNNHEGDESVAAELIRRAAAAGAGAVKLQAIVPHALVSSDDPARIEQLGRLCLPLDAFPRLAGVAEEAGVLFLCTPFDRAAVDVLEPHVAAYKVASGDLTCDDLLDGVAATGKPVILSTGMADRVEIEAAIRRLEAGWSDPTGLALLHCVSSYPTPIAQANLLAVRTLADFGVTIGYSDHVIGNEAALLSVALGARIIEKHVTLANDYSSFRDHQLAADPDALADLVRRLDDAQAAFGDGLLDRRPAEEATATAARRSAAAARDLEAGHVLQAGDIAWLRPATGVSPSAAVGRRLTTAVARGATIHESDLG